MFWVGYRLKTRNRGVKLEIGGSGEYWMDYCFLEHDFSQVGDDNNDGFDCFLQMCRNKMCVLDVGAHIGLYALPACRALEPGGTVHCFEPSDSNRRCLSRHVEINFPGRIKVNSEVVGRGRGEATFYESTLLSGLNSMVLFKELDSGTWVTKQQTSVDDYVGENGLRPEVLKIDAEGYEKEVLLGALGTMEEHRPVGLLSVHPQHLKLLGESPDSLKDVVGEVGYTFRELSGEPADKLSAREYILDPGPSGG
jgi:FkbM family methyltransferase